MRAAGGEMPGFVGRTSRVLGFTGIGFAAGIGLAALGCAEPPVAVVAPEAHTWPDEAELVVKGLEDVERMWESGQKSAAATLAERVYAERFEPRLEPALREMEGPTEAAAVEYGFGQLLVALAGKDRAKIALRVDTLQRRTRAIAESAARAFPPPGQAPEAPPPPKDVRPLVPDVPANWEQGEVDAGEGGELRN